MKRLSRRFLSLVMVVVLVVGGLVAGVSYIQAGSNVKIRILEITDRKNVNSSGEETGVVSELGNLGSDYEVRTISMKNFVALREELDGKYDAIYIASGTYSTKAVQGVDHNTKAVMNDITTLKAKEIREKFIEKGQPVVLHEDIFKDNASKLKANFYTYKTNPVANVKVVKQAADAVAYIKTIDINTLKRPHMEMTNAPDDYLKGSSTVYKPGDTVSFSYRIADYKKLSSQAKVNLYLDMNFDRKYEASEMLASASLSSAEGELKYKLTGGYSGMRYWKLEVEDMGTRLKTYETGAFRFRDRVVEVRTLQVTKDSSTASSLLNTNNMKSNYLINPDNPDYKIRITVKTMTDFNTTEHKKLNGNYDMLIFGFADSYNGSGITEEAAKSVEKFIATGQGVMFTHDTIFNTGNNWVKYFMDDTGQIAPMTDLGRGAPNTSKSTQKMNEGMINQYPFKLDDSIAVNTTHNQYYTLDLEDETVVPWYNIIGSKRDRDDSWNHFYTYSKGTVTYSGTGHTNTNFPDPEQRLFVNTIYRAFIGANHRPEITVYTPKNNDRIRTIDPLEIVWKAEDFDLTDQFLTTKVTIYNNEGQDITPQNPDNPNIFTDIRTGSIMKYTLSDLPSDLRNNGGTLTIKIEASDRRGAQAEPVILTVDVKKIIAKLYMDRENEVKATAGVEVPIHYKVTALPITEKLSNGVAEMPVTSIVFRETFPAGLEVIVPDGFTRTGTVESGYTVTKTFDNIVYRKQANGTYKVEGTDLAFELKVKATEGEKYVLANSSISYTDLDRTPNVEAKFPAFILNAEPDVTGIQISPKPITMQVGETITAFATVSPDASMAKHVTWDWQSNTSVAEITAQTGETVVIKGLNPGKAVLRATIQTADGKTLTDTCEVTITAVPVRGISLPAYIQVKKDDSHVLTPVFTPVNAANKQVIWSSDHPEWVTVDQKGQITGLVPGKTAVITAKTVDGGYEAKTVVHVMQVTLDKQAMTIRPGETDKITATVKPDDAPNKAVSWTSSDPSVATVDANGNVRAIKEGTVTIIATVIESGATATSRVTVANDELIPKFRLETMVIGDEAIVRIIPTDLSTILGTNPGPPTKWFVTDGPAPAYTGTAGFEGIFDYETFIVSKTGGVFPPKSVWAVQPNNRGKAVQSVIYTEEVIQTDLSNIFRLEAATGSDLLENRAAKIRIYPKFPDQWIDKKIALRVDQAHFEIINEKTGKSVLTLQADLPSSGLVVTDGKTIVSHLFKTQSGQSGSYRVRFKIDRASLLVPNGSKTIDKAINMAGFENVGGFTVSAKENMK